MANDRHSAYDFRLATIAYWWHPLAGRRVRVAPFRRGKELKCIYTDERLDLCRELPNWMFEAAYCAGMELRPPAISLAEPAHRGTCGTAGDSRARCILSSFKREGDGRCAGPHADAIARSLCWR